MKFRIIAVGNRAPAWVQDGYTTFARRMPPEMPLELIEISAPKHHRDPDKFRRAEGDKALAQVDNSDWVIALDERGKTISSQQLAGRFEQWRQVGQDVVFMIGGSDGLAPAVPQTHPTARRESPEVWSDRPS